MIESHDIGGLQGAPVLGPDDERVGSVGQVYVDPATDRPTWVSVRTGLFGRHESVVPLDGAEWDNERLRIPYDKETLKAAPRYDAHAPLTAEQEDELTRFYRLSDPTLDPDEAVRLRGDAVHERASRRTSAAAGHNGAAGHESDPGEPDQNQPDQNRTGYSESERDDIGADSGTETGRADAGTETGRADADTETGPKHAATAGGESETSAAGASVHRRTVEQQAAARRAGDVSPEPTEEERLAAERARSHGPGTTDGGHPSPRDM
ncbi:hypothetical protein GCM10027416_30360 [Okibacterium endophyticum]